jgi:hypothetical protein
VCLNGLRAHAEIERDRLVGSTREDAFEHTLLPGTSAGATRVATSHN